MFHKLLMRLLLALVLLFCINVMIRPAWADCPVLVELIGPDSVKSGNPANYLVRIENQSSCDISNLSIVEWVPKWTKFRRSNPPPSTVKDRSSPHGPKVTWLGVHLNPGEVKLFEIGVRMKADPGVFVTNRFCVEFPEGINSRICQNLKIWVS